MTAVSTPPLDAAGLAVRFLRGAIRVSGPIRWSGRELLGARDRDLRAVRAAGIGTVFQKPARARDPVRRAGAQVTDVIRVHTDIGRDGLRNRDTRLIDMREPERDQRMRRALASLPPRFILAGGCRG